MKKTDNLISFIIPCYRSENTIEKVIDEIVATVAERSEYDYEVICVNDMSPDGVWDVLQKIAAKNEKVKLINFAKNQGKHSALMAGHAAASGEYVVDIDDDFQSPVNNLWKLMEPVVNGECDVAMANYFKKSESLFKRFGSWVNKRMIASMLEKPVNLHWDNFTVMRRYISDAILEYKNPYPYMEGLIFSVTRNVHIVMMEDRSRADDNSTGYTFKKSLDLWMNGLTAFSVKPLRVASMVGIIFAVAGFIWGTIILLQKFVFHTIEVLGYASLASIMLFATGVMMIMLGLMGEYIGRMYISMNHIPQYTIKEKVNFDKEEES